MGTKAKKANITIIGAGIIGCAIARELSRFANSVLVIEKKADVGWGTTKANSGIIHPGYAGDEGTLRLDLSSRGNLLFKKNAEELEIPFKNTGSFLNILDFSKITSLENLLNQGRRCGCNGLSIITDFGKLRKEEPNISSNVCASLYSEQTHIVSPYEAAIALFENASYNSVEFIFNSEVTGISYNRNSHIFLIEASGSSSFNMFNNDITGGINQRKIIIETDFVINAAGINADKVAGFIGDDSFKIEPVKGEYLLFDSEVGDFVNKVNYRFSEGKSKGVLVSPTTGGNFLIGPNYKKSDKVDFSNTSNGINEVKKKADEIFDGIPYNKVITSFAGLRAVSDNNDFIISPSFKNNKFINVAGIQSPGLTCAFSICEVLIDVLKDNGLKLLKNRKFVPIRKSIKKFKKNNPENNLELYSSDIGYGEVICRCEGVTKAEVIEAIQRGATTLDGIKFRTRAGMGRCQGGYCTLKLIKLISDTLNLPYEEVTKFGEDSYIVSGKTN